MQYMFKKYISLNFWNHIDDYNALTACVNNISINMWTDDNQLNLL